MSDSASASRLDPRRHAYREDIADISLKNKVNATQYVEGTRWRVSASSVPLRRKPENALGYDTELRAGEEVSLFEQRGGWGWGQAVRDGYVGYLPMEALAAPGPAPDHRVRALRSFLYPGPSIKATPLGFLPFLSEIHLLETEGHWGRCAQGYLYLPHLAPAGQPLASDPVAIAERFLGIPYLWGGKTSLGLDCSGLVQTGCFACGISAPRDSDMQEAELGTALPLPADPAHLPRGALLFWPGHVALSQGNGRMIHANAHHMQVESEPIMPALQRIEAAGSALRSVRLLPRS